MGEGAWVSVWGTREGVFLVRYRGDVCRYYRELPKETATYLGIIDAQNNWHPVPKFEDNVEEHVLDKAWRSTANWTTGERFMFRALIDHIKAIEEKLEDK